MLCSNTYCFFTNIHNDNTIYANTDNNSNNCDYIVNPNISKCERFIDREIFVFNHKMQEIEHLWSNISTPKITTPVYNISKYNLTDPEKSLLGKGLKFCPTPPKADLGDICHDIDHFFRSANLN